MSKNKTYLTKEQRSWIIRNFTKLAVAAEKQEAKKICNKLANKVLDSKSYVSFSKAEKGTILSTLVVAMKGLDAAIAKYKEDEDKFADYLKAANDKKKVLQKLEEKLQK